MRKIATWPFAAALLTSLISWQNQPEPVKTGVKTPGVKIPIERLKPEAVFAVPGAPDWIAVYSGPTPIGTGVEPESNRSGTGVGPESNRSTGQSGAAVWISNKPKDAVVRLDPMTNTVAATIAVGKRPCSGLAVGFGSLWVPNCGDSTIARVDLKTGEVTATLKTTIANSEGSIASGAGSIWIMTDAMGTLARFDPDTNKVVAEIYVPSGSFGLAFAGGADEALWVTSTEHDSVSRIDPHTNLVVETIPVGKAPRFIAAGEGGVWTLNQGDGSVSRIDPKTNKVVATVEVGVPGGGGDIAAGEGSVWVTSFDFPLSRIDPSTNTVVQQFVGKGGDAVRTGLGSVWLCNLAAGIVWRLDPRRIEATLPN